MIQINSEKCNACGICGIVCPRHVLETVEINGEKTTRIAKEREDLCLDCGQCTAVCPSDAVFPQDRDPDVYTPVQPLQIPEEALLTLMEQRRSVRRYKDQPVPREKIDRIIEACRRAPTGTASRSTGVIVVDTPAALAKLSGLFHKVYQDLENALKNPIARFIIKKQVGYRTFAALQDFVMPGMHWYLKWKKQGKGDEILRDCKALMLFHSPVLEPMGETNCALSAFHGIFMAEILGIGTCFNDLIPPACNRDKQIREFLGLPDDREIYSSLTLGIPKFKYRKTIPRELADVRYIA